VRRNVKQSKSNKQQSVLLTTMIIESAFKTA